MSNFGSKMSFKLGKYINFYICNSDNVLKPYYGGFELKGQKIYLNKSIKGFIDNYPIMDFKNYVKEKSIFILMDNIWYFVEVDYNTERLLDTMNQSEILF